MKNKFNSIEAFSQYLDTKYKKVTYKILFEELQKLNILQQLLDDGYSYDDIVFSIKRKIKLEHHFCPQCNSEIHVYKLSRYPKCCSVSCAVKQSQPLRIERSIEKYGVSHPMQNDLVKNKVRDTMIDSYGGYTFQSDILMKQVKRSNLDKYGVEIAASNKELHKKNEKTCLDKYGVTHTSKLKENRQQAKETNKRLHGSETYNNTPKREKSCLIKYGVTNPAKCHEIRVKSQTRYVYLGIGFDSSWEIAYYIWLTDNNIEFEYQPSITFTYYFHGKTYSYHPDFKIGEQFIEIKGDQYFDKDGNMICPYNRKNDELYQAKFRCMIEHNIIVFRKKDIQQYLEYVDSKYGKNYLNQFKNKR